MDSISPRHVASAPSSPKSVRNPITGRSVMPGIVAAGIETAPGGGRAPSRVARAEGGAPRPQKESGFGRIDHVGRARARGPSVVDARASPFARREGEVVRGSGDARVRGVLEPTADDC